MRFEEAIQAVYAYRGIDVIAKKGLVKEYQAHTQESSNDSNKSYIKEE